MPSWMLKVGEVVQKETQAWASSSKEGKKSKTGREKNMVNCWNYEKK